MNVLAVLPYLDEHLYREAVGSLTDKRVDVLGIDNTVVNRGVTAAWNAAARLVVSTDSEYEWLLLWSTAIVFGDSGGSDFVDRLEDAPAYGPPFHRAFWWPRLVSGIGCGWHLTAINWEVLRHVGVFDDQAFFAYYSDTDWIHRHKLSGLGDLWTEGHTQVPVDLRVNRGDGHSIHRGLVTPDLGAEQRAYVAKWGGHGARAERYDHPYNDPTLDWTYVGPPPGGTL